jgi:AcrR family transcriptional regulator
MNGSHRPTVAPRTYNLGRRAETTAETNRRILAAAIEVFQAGGLAGTSLAEVARRADVSRGTVVNHFGSVDALLNAVLDDIVEQLELPDTRILEGAADETERVRRFVDALCRFYERSSPWWQTFGRGFEGNPVYQEQEARFWAQMHALARESLGPAVEDRVIGTAVWTLLHPWPYGQLRYLGLTVEESIDVLVPQVLVAVGASKEVDHSPGS